MEFNVLITLGDIFPLFSGETKSKLACVLFWFKGCDYNFDIPKINIYTPH